MKMYFCVYRKAYAFYTCSQLGGHLYETVPTHTPGSGNPVAGKIYPSKTDGRVDSGYAVSKDLSY